MMRRRTFLGGAASLAALSPTIALAQGGRTAVVLWHAMTGALADELNKLVARFNASQKTATVTTVFKGGYPQTLTAAIAAWRAGQAPHIAQVFDVGTGSMIAAGPAVKPLWQLVKETGVAIPPAHYVPAIRGYYSLEDGRMAALPFNSSTAVMWYDKDAFEKAGLDPETPPATWPEVVKAAETLKAKNAARYAVTTSWPAWVHFEQFASIHNVPYATEDDGFKGLDSELLIDSSPFAANLQRLLDMAKSGTFKYAGRGSAGDRVFYAGAAAIAFGSSGMRGNLVKSAKFRWADAYLPYDPAVIAKPINSIIGGASFWTMTAPHRTAVEYKAVAEFLAFLGKPDQDADWSAQTGYVPVTLGGFAKLKRDGFFAKNPGTEVPIRQLSRGPVTNNSRGIRLGNMPEIRVIILEEWERAMESHASAKDVLAKVVERGNKVLRAFQKSVAD